jgi:hypothetical protein
MRQRVRTLFAGGVLMFAPIVTVAFLAVSMGHAHAAGFHIRPEDQEYCREARAGLTNPVWERALCDGEKHPRLLNTHIAAPPARQVTATWIIVFMACGSNGACAPYPAPTPAFRSISECKQALTRYPVSRRYKCAVQPPALNPRAGCAGPDFVNDGVQRECQDGL